MLDALYTLIVVPAALQLFLEGALLVVSLVVLGVVVAILFSELARRYFP